MGYRKDITRSQMYMESTEIFNKTWFNVKKDKFYHNVDTLYYTISLKNDYNKNPEVNDFIYELQEKKNIFKETREPQIMNDKLFVLPGRFDDIYEYRLSCPENYDIFITSYLPNQQTPRIVVQLRSAALWIAGIKKTIEDSYYQISKLLGAFDLKVEKVMENRIDYCYHTNYIQNMWNFFSDKYIDKHEFGNLDNWRKEGRKILGNRFMNYYALGSRNSNNLFVRIYDKTREVTEMAYKGFFIDIWRREGLISEYDKYCLEYAYIHQNYEKRYEGMLNFYLEFGKDERHKAEIEKTLQDPDVNFVKIYELANALCPPTTTIVNIEFQTKRKFYSGGDNLIDSLSMFQNCQQLQRLIKIIDNRKMFLDYITHHNLRFVKEDGQYCDWWSRLRGLKMDVLDSGKEYARTYQHNLDKQLMKKKQLRTLATFSLYQGGIESDAFEDIADLICTLNDNDLYKGSDLRIVNPALGEVIESIDNDIMKEYKEYKEKKYRAIKNQLDIAECEDSSNND